MLPVNSATEDSYDSGNISFISPLCTPDPNSPEIPSTRSSCINVSVFQGTNFSNLYNLWGPGSSEVQGEGHLDEPTLLKVSLGFFPVIISFVINGLLGESYYISLK